MLLPANVCLGMLNGCASKGGLKQNQYTISKLWFEVVNSLMYLFYTW